VLGGLTKLLRRTALLLVVIIVGLLAFRIYDTQRGPPLEPWHTYVPHELTAKALDHADWTDYLKAEDKIFADVKRHVSQYSTRTSAYRSIAISKAVPSIRKAFRKTGTDPMCSNPRELQSERGILHGLTDSPYSLRHIARRYREHGFVSIAIRLPAHGTVPGALTDVEWQDWMAATRLAVREARRRIGHYSLCI